MTASLALQRGTQVALFIIATAGIVASYRLGLWGMEGPGSGLFPMLSSLLLLICVGIRLAIPGPETAPEEPVNWPRLGWYTASLVIYTVLFLYTGFAIGTAVGVFVLMRFAEERPVLPAIVASLIATAICILIFDYLLAVPMPYGPLQFLKFWM